MRLLFAFALLLALPLALRAQEAPAVADSADAEEEVAPNDFEPSKYRIQRVHLPLAERGPQAGVSRGRYIVNFGSRDGVQPGSIFRAMYRGQLMGLLKVTRAWRDTTELTMVQLVHKSDLSSPYPLNPGYYLEPHLVLLETIHFDSGKPIIDPAMYERLHYASRFVRSFPQFPLIVEGHTDALGKADENKLLSQERAQGVLTFLNEVYRIPLEQLHAVGYGQTRPVASNRTQEGRYQNRRVDILLMNKRPIVAKVDTSTAPAK
jgi:outer membrane protein OmpA-like peptidoglycan-associated protein